MIQFLKSDKMLDPVGYTQGIQFHRECGLIMVGFIVCFF